jgi:ferrous iron transport protein B
MMDYNTETKVKESPNEDILDLADKYRWEVGDNLHDSILEAVYKDAEEIAAKAVISDKGEGKFDTDRFIDKVVTSKWTGFPIMFLLLSVVFWLTISGANYPSGLIANFLVDTVHPWLKDLANTVGVPWFISGVLIDGAYLAMAWVVSVMLPPMAIFFPMFTLLEDFGYLPRVAFNMDNIYRRVGAHG